MDHLAQGVGTVGGVMAAQYVPGYETMDPMMKMGVYTGAMILGNVGAQLFQKLPTIDSIMHYWRPQPYALYISQSGPIFQRIETYIIHKYVNSIRACQVEPRNGEIAMTLNDLQLDKPIYDTFETQEVQLHLIQKNGKYGSTKSMLTDLQTMFFDVGGYDASSSANSDTKNSENQRLVIITSWTLKLTDLRRYIATLCHFKKNARELRMYIASKKSGKKDETKEVKWEELHVKTNKRLSNTIVNETVEKELVQDVKWFMGSEEWYNDKGIPWKRGYIMHGVTGSGKTSLVKSIAAEYDLPVFIIDFDVVKKNEHFSSLMHKLHYYTENKPYILAFEDLDRSNVLKRYHYSDTPSISVQCLLNEIDGLIESHGRLLFITANDKKAFDKVDENALMRPGRIDVVVEVGVCDFQQLKRFLIHFFGMKYTAIWDRLTPQLMLKTTVTPAQVINILQKHASDEAPNNVIGQFFAVDTIQTELGSDDCIVEITNLPMADPKIKSIQDQIDKRQQKISADQNKLKGFNIRLKRAEKDKELWPDRQKRSATRLQSRIDRHTKGKSALLKRVENGQKSKTQLQIRLKKLKQDSAKKSKTDNKKRKCLPIPPVQPTDVSTALPTGVSPKRISSRRRSR